MELLVPAARPARAPFPHLLPSFSSCRAPTFSAVDAAPLGTPTDGSLSPRTHHRSLSLVLASQRSPFSQLRTFRSPSRSWSSPPPAAAAVAAAGERVSSVAPCTRWAVVMERPPTSVGSSRAEVIDYYVETLARVLGDEKEAQMCIYSASWQTQFLFCCDIDEEVSNELAGLPGVLSVGPDTDFEPVKSSSNSNSLLSYLSRSEGRTSKFSPSRGNSDYWLVRMRKPGVEVVTKAQIVDYYAETLAKVLGNEKDAQVSIYHISWEKDFEFCCQIDGECARELADVPEVLHVCPDIHFDSKNKEYGGDDVPQKQETRALPEKDQIPNIKTKRLFVTGLSFYTSEKTLRAAFEGFGELVEVKIIMDRISKRSKGYAFIEYTTEEAASAALKEMNGKIINGWMIVVDVAKTNPSRYSREHQRPSDSARSSY